MMTRSVRLLAVAAGLVCLCTGMSGQDRGGSSRPPSTAGGDWPHYTADMRGTKYSPLDQITAANFGKLEVAWRFKTDILGPRLNTSWKGHRSPSTASCTPRVEPAARWSRSTGKPVS
jgi:glucose dehydrogenase